MSLGATGILQPMRERTWAPGVALAAFVESCSLREDWLGGVEIYNPLPARADCFLQIYIEDRYKVVTVASGALHRAPRCVLVGPHTRRREDLIWTGHLKIFTVRFRAVGFQALFGVAASALTNYAGDAEMVLGPSVRELESRLGDAEDERLGEVAEAWLMERLREQEVEADGGVGALMVRRLEARRGAVSVGELAERYGRSVRQVERIFAERVGVSPKVYARLARLKFGMRLGLADAKPDWAGIALEAGYFDQSHMVREFKALNGATPVEYAELSRRAVEYRGMRGKLRDVAFVLSVETMRR